MPNVTLTENQNGKTLKNDKLVFRHIPAYASFVKETQLIPYIQEQIRISREINLPMLKFIDNIPDEDLVTMSVEPNKAFLVSAENNKLRQHIEKSMETWVADRLGVMKREELTAEDITLVGYVRKKALMKFLPSYTADVFEAIEIIKEIDIYTVESATIATNIYINLLKDRINEQTFFTEKLSNTTPGLLYTYDLEQLSIKYSNKNYLKFFGLTLKQVQEMGPSIRKKVVHPDDIILSAEGIEKCKSAADEEVISWEYRLKNADEEYVWMRNYSSVLKRNEANIPVEMVGIILDINVEKETANKLIIRERQLLEAQRQTQVGSFELDVETGKMDVTPQFCEIYEMTDFVLNNLIDHVHPGDRARINANRDEAIKNNTPYDNEYRYLINGKEKIIRSRGIVSIKNGRKVLAGTAQDITEKQVLIERLKASEELFKQAQARTHIGNWTWDIPANKVTWSDEMYRVYGLEPQSEEVTYETYISHIHPADREDRIKQVQHVFETGEPEDHHYRIIRPDGNITILHTKSEIVYDENGKPLQMTGTCQDITEKQLLIDRLLHSEFLYKQAQAISHIGNWAWDMETKKIDWSDEIYRIHELELQSLDTSTSLIQYTHPEDETVIRSAISHAVETSQPFDFNYRILLKSGKVKTLNAKGEIKSGQDSSVKIFGTLQDITEQKSAEKKLNDYQDFIKKITDVTPSIIVAYNIHTGKYSFINDAIEKLLGYPVAKIMDEGILFLSSIVHPDDLPGLMEKNQKALEEANQKPVSENEPIVDFKYRMRHQNGIYRWFHTFGTIFERNDKGLVESVLNISIDITGQESAEQALFQKNLQLQQSNTSLEEYAYVASHDLKEPLRKISTFSDRLLTAMQPALNDESRNYLNKIIDASRRMQNMINDLLSVSTISGNLAYESCDLNVILKEALVPLEHKIEEQKATIEIDPLPSAVVVASQFRQLFQNLVSNSLKFARTGTSLHIKITNKTTQKVAGHLNLAPSKKYLQLQFEDNGIGFENEYAEKIFTIFQRLHGKAEYDGTGIGLAICKKIVENHGGIIFATGVVNQGAVFTIIIPV